MAARKRGATRPEPLTASAIVALNVRRIREERGWTQAEAGIRLEKVTGRPWSVATLSALERGWDREGPERAFGVNVIAIKCSPLTTPGRKRCFCSSLPRTVIAREVPCSAI